MEESEEVGVRRERRGVWREREWREREYDGGFYLGKRRTPRTKRVPNKALWRSQLSLRPTLRYRRYTQESDVVSIPNKLCCCLGVLVRTETDKQPAWTAHSV